MMHCNLFVVTILVLFKYVHCTVPEARVRCEEKANSYISSNSSDFVYLYSQFDKSQTGDTIFCKFFSEGTKDDFGIVMYLKLPTFEDHPYINLVIPETSGTCLETQKVSISMAYKEGEEYEYGFEFIELTFEYEKNARFDLVKPDSEDCDWRKSFSSFKSPCYLDFIMEKHWWFFQIEVESNQTLMHKLIPENATLSSLTVRCKYYDIVNKLNIWLSDFTNEIKILDLSNCLLEENANILSLLELKELFLRNSKTVKGFLNNCTKNFPNLEVLHLSGNDEFNIRNTLQNMSKLKELDISNTILDVTPGALKLPSTVTILRATKLLCTAKTNVTDENGYREIFPISECDDEANALILCMLNEYSNLQRVVLSNNNFKEITSDSFLNLTTNATVVLTNNKIFDINNLHLKSLFLMDLTKNNISRMNDMKMDGYIENLNLSYNKIAIWNVKDVFNSESLHINFVNLSYNKISSISSVMLKSLSSLKAVDIGNNPIDCNDCSLKDLQLWLKDPRRKTVVTNLGEPYTTLKCTYPSQLSNTLILEAQYNNLCDGTTNLIISISIPLPLLLLITSLLVYVFRFQLLYVIHMIRIRKRADKNCNVQQKNFEYDVFVSYSSADRSWVFENLMKTLESEEYKYTLCLHERDFHLGKYIMDNIVDSIEKSRHVIVVLSPNFVSSQWCQWELKLVQQLIFENNPEFLILIELQKMRPKDLPSTFRLLMSTRTYLECPGEGSDMSSFWRRLTKILGEPNIKQCNVESECPENIIEQLMEMYQQEVNEILTSPESLIPDNESTL